MTKHNFVLISQKITIVSLNSIPKIDLVSNNILLYFCLKLFLVLMGWVAKQVQTTQRMMKGHDLNLSLCTKSEVIALKKTDFIHCITLDGGFSR